MVLLLLQQLSLVQVSRVVVLTVLALRTSWHHGLLLIRSVHGLLVLVLLVGGLSLICLLLKGDNLVNTFLALGLSEVESTS